VNRGSELVAAALRREHRWDTGERESEAWATPTRDAFGNNVGVMITGDLKPQPPEPPLKCRTLCSFSNGIDETGRVVDLAVGQVVEIEGRRARNLARRGFVEILVDRKAEAAAREAAKRERIAAAVAAAAPPPPPPPLPEPAAVPEGEGVMVRTLKSFSLGGGRDVEAGVVLTMTVEDAERRVRGRLVEVIEPGSKA